MPLKKDQIEHLTQQIYQMLRKDNLIKILTTEKDVIKVIRDVLLVDAQTEIDILNKASATMEQFKQQIQSGQIEHDKMYTMVKKQLAKEKKFTF